MTKKQAIQLFEEKKVRTVWDDEQEKWYFSIVDVCGVLTDSKDALTARKYWNKLKQRLKEEGNETVTNCHQLKLRAADGKMRLADVADTEQLFRLIQSIPSPKAEPFKRWIAQVASQRLDQMQNPELSIDQVFMSKNYPYSIGLPGRGDRYLGMTAAMTQVPVPSMTPIHFHGILTK